VLVDRTLKPADCRVYACLSSRTFKGDSVSAGLRWIAESLGVSRMTVKRSVGRLAAAGHIEITAEGTGSRPPLYRLTSGVFAKRQKVIVSDGRGNREMTRAELDRRRELTLKLRTA
jgi:DNA-binding MarR family transcriptional regulator